MSGISREDKKNLALIKLDGTLVKADGTEKPSSYFDFLKIPLEDYAHITFTPAEAEQVKKKMRAASTGATNALPLICPGENLCGWRDTCPLVKIDRERRLQKQIQEDFDLQRIDGMEGRPSDPVGPTKSVVPVGSPCWVETTLMNQWIEQYIVEYDINPTNFTEFQMASELAEIEILLRRLNFNLAKPENADLIQENIIGFDKFTSAPLTKKEVSSIFEARERLQTRKSRLIKLMVGDPQEKYKREAALKQKSESDPSISAAKLRASITNLIDQAKIYEKRLKEGEAIEVSEVRTLPEEEKLTPEQLISSITKEGD